MQYKLLLYVFFTFVAAFGISGLNINQFIRKNRVWEARVLCMVLSFSLGYLLTNFVIDFLNL